MANYSEYIDKLKISNPPADYGKMLANINRKTAKQPLFHLPQLQFAITASLVILLLSFGFYLTYPINQASNDEVLMSYVFNGETIDDSVLLDYVFEN